MNNPQSSNNEKIMSPYNIFSLFKSLQEIHAQWYAKIENNILKGETSERFRIKKSIILYHCYLMILFFLLVSVLTPMVPFYTSFAHIMASVTQIFILKSKSYYQIGTYVKFHAIASLVFQYVTDGEQLTTLGTVLINQHMFFLFPENQILAKAYIPIVLVLTRRMQSQGLLAIDSWDILKLESLWKGFYTIWPAIFLLHHYCAKSLINSYRLALIKNVEIQQEIEKKSQQLEKANKELKQALQARELFIASVSHELRNPLNCMIGNIELLRLDIKEEKWLKMLDICKIASEVLLGQINNVLDVAKINAEKLELHNVPNNFHQLIEKIWSISVIPIQKKKLHGQVFISKKFPKIVELDSHRFTQILLNIIGNATKFTKNGFINLKFTWHQNESMKELATPSADFEEMLNHAHEHGLLKGSPSQINSEKDLSPINEEPSYEFESPIERVMGINSIKREIVPKLMSQIKVLDYIQISNDESVSKRSSFHFTHQPREKGIMKIEITDSGCGLSEEAQKNIFEAFKQGSSSVACEYGGTGLGLYITKQIVEKMGGQIHIFSKEKVGTNFCILIPAETGSSPIDTITEIQDQQEKPVCVRALVVDSAVENQTMYSDYLKNLHIHADSVGNGKAALKMIHQKGLNYYSLLIMDIQLPVLDGIDTCKEIRKFEVSQKQKNFLPIIIVTANCAQSNKIQCLDPHGDIRASSFHTKPFTFNECKATIQSLFSNNTWKNQKFRYSF